MPWAIGEPCIDVKDRTCVEVCPVDCIYELTAPGELTTPSGALRIASPNAGERMLYIHPVECISCGVCEPVCPVDAIREVAALPREWRSFTEVNRAAFKDLADQDIVSGTQPGPR